MTCCTVPAGFGAYTTRRRGDGFVVVAGPIWPTGRTNFDSSLSECWSCSQDTSSLAEFRNIEGADRNHFAREMNIRARMK
jgi:hypothetical protein